MTTPCIYPSCSLLILYKQPNCMLDDEKPVGDPSLSVFPFSANALFGVGRELAAAATQPLILLLFETERSKPEARSRQLERIQCIGPRSWTCFKTCEELLTKE